MCPNVYNAKKCWFFAFYSETRFFCGLKHNPALNKTNADCKTFLVALDTFQYNLIKKIS